MASSFVHTLRALERQPRAGVWLVPGLVLLGGWGAWMHWARIDVYASAARARIEVARMAHRASAQAAGRIVELACELGRNVVQGELLAQLDSSVERAELEHARSELVGLGLRITALQDQLVAEQAKHVARSRVDALATRQADLGLRRAQLTATHQAELTQIARELHRRQLTAPIDANHADVELAGSRLQVDDAAVQLERQHARRAYEDKAELARLAEVRRSLADLRAQESSQRATIASLLAQLDRRRILAPANGRLGNIAALQVGDVVQPGDVIATVVPADDVRVVAEFVPDDAIGRIVPGRSARMRLQGFSFIEYGSLRARVSHVANEPHAGTIRAELVLEAAQVSSITPLQHGLPAMIDVAVETTSPWTLLLRSIGLQLAKPAGELRRRGVER